MASVLASSDINPLCPVYAPFFGAMVSIRGIMRGGIKGAWVTISY